MLTLLRQGQAAIKRRLGRSAHALMLTLTLMFAGMAVMAPAGAMAQNLGTAPAVGQAVQGQTAAQPEGTLLNVVNWVGNVICPVGAALFVVAAVAPAAFDLPFPGLPGGCTFPWRSRAFALVIYLQ